MRQDNCFFNFFVKKLENRIEAGTVVAWGAPAPLQFFLLLNGALKDGGRKRNGGWNRDEDRCFYLFKPSPWMWTGTPMQAWNQRGCGKSIKVHCNNRRFLLFAHQNIQILPLIAFTIFSIPSDAQRCGNRLILCEINNSWFLCVLKLSAFVISVLPLRSKIQSTCGQNLEGRNGSLMLFYQ